MRAHKSSLLDKWRQVSWGGDYLKYCLCCAMFMAENNEFCGSANEDSVKMMMEFFQYLKNERGKMLCQDRLQKMI